MRFKVSREVYDLMLQLPDATAAHADRMRADLTLTMGLFVSIECDASLVEDEWIECDRSGREIRRGKGIIRPN